MDLGANAASRLKPLDSTLNIGSYEGDLLVAHASIGRPLMHGQLRGIGCPKPAPRYRKSFWDRELDRHRSLVPRYSSAIGV